MNTPNHSDTYTEALLRQIKKVISKLSMPDSKSQSKQTQGINDLAKHMTGQFNEWILLDEDSLEVVNIRSPESENSNGLV